MKTNLLALELGTPHQKANWDTHPVDLSENPLAFLWCEGDSRRDLRGTKSAPARDYDHRRGGKRTYSGSGIKITLILGDVVWRGS